MLPERVFQHHLDQFKLNKGVLVGICKCQRIGFGIRGLSFFIAAKAKKLEHNFLSPVYPCRIATVFNVVNPYKASNPFSRP